MNSKDAKTALTLLRENIKTTEEEVNQVETKIAELQSGIAGKKSALIGMSEYQRFLEKLAGEEQSPITPEAEFQPPIEERRRRLIIPLPKAIGRHESILMSVISKIEGDFKVADLYVKADELNSGLTPTQVYNAFQNIKGKYDEIVHSAGRRAAIYRKRA